MEHARTAAAAPQQTLLTCRPNPPPTSHPAAALLPACLPARLPARLQLLLYPNPSDPLNGEAAALHMRDPAAFQRKVKDYVQRFAKAEDVAALEEKEKRGGGSGEQGEGMSEDGSGERGREGGREGGDTGFSGWLELGCVCVAAGWRRWVAMACNALLGRGSVLIRFCMAAPGSCVLQMATSLAAAKRRRRRRRSRQQGRWSDRQR